MKLFQIETNLPKANQILDSSQLYALKIKDMASLCTKNTRCYISISYRKLDNRKNS